MASEKPDVLLVGTPKPVVVDGLAPISTVHRLGDAGDRDAALAAIAERIRGMAVTYTTDRVDGAFLSRFPNLEIVASFGVGYDHVDAAWAGQHGIVVTNTPDVLTEEVADTAIGLLLCTVRELPQAERFLRAGKWLAGPYPLSRTTLRTRTVGMLGLGRIGKAIARRLDAFGIPVVYHARRPAADVAYRYFASLLDMARAVDTLMVIVPGGAATRHLVNAEVLEALGPDGIVINVARGSVIDDAALIAALRAGTILSAGLDVFVNEPEVPREYLEMEHIVLLPHLGSASVHTRNQMDQLVVENLRSWFAGKGPLTPVPETPWAPRARLRAPPRSAG